MIRPSLSRSTLLRFYDPFSRLFGAREAHWQLVAQAGIEPGSTVLDLGTGTGNVLRLAAEAAPDATLIGIDPDPQALLLARRKLPGVRIEQAAASAIPCADGSVDRVLCAFVFHHIADDERAAALAEVRRVLAPGGRLHLIDFDGLPNPNALVAGVNIALGMLERGEGHAHDRDFAHSDRDTVLAHLEQAGFTAELSGRGRSGMGDYLLYRAVPTEP
ncbi:hypothetical protein GCM10009836_27210 [Pseudonocardia ailaonensis]|uniref:Methyltransferase domain-containing protein n=1 Tax=Pseudonocardia ailaonensis TaxID=367279 RepID=A0ABN2N396_9PSEU